MQVGTDQTRIICLEYTTVMSILQMFLNEYVIQSLFCLALLPLYLFPFLLFYPLAKNMRWTTHVIQRLVSKERFYAGCQPRCPSEHLYRRRKFKSPARTHRISLVRARYPSEYLYVLVLILPSRSTAFTCRYTELLAHSYYTRSRAIQQPILKISLGNFL